MKEGIDARKSKDLLAKDEKKGNPRDQANDDRSFAEVHPRDLTPYASVQQSRAASLLW